MNDTIQSERTSLIAPLVGRLSLLGRALACVAMLAVFLPVVVLTGAPSAAADAARVLTFEVSGAQGGQGGGGGGVIVATKLLAPGSTILVTVGGSNGYNGGGAAGSSPSGTPGAGGGATDLRFGGVALSNRVLVAGGGGGRGGETYSSTPGGGGGAGAATGNGGNGGDGTGVYSWGLAGGGASTSGGGGGGGNRCFSGECGNGGDGGNGVGGDGGYGYAGVVGSGGGGGGGGYFGGGGGGGSCCSNSAGGGGGGSSYVDSTTFPDGPDSATDGAHSGDGQVRISLDGGDTWVTTFSYTGAPESYTVPFSPQASSLDETTGPTVGGTTVTLTGLHLSDVSAMTLCGQSVSDLTVVDDTTVTFATPPHATGTCDLDVSTHASGPTTLPSAFRYYPIPTITSSTPAAGPLSGAVLTLTGTGFTTATAVHVGTAAATFTVDSDTSITATAPSGTAGVATISVTTPDTTGTGPASYTYTAAPTITTAAPSAGADSGGASVVVTGTHLTGATSVVFGATPATSFTVDSDTQITAVAPALSIGSTDVTVTTAGGSATRTDGYRAYPVPDVTAVAPTNGPAAGGATVVVTGTHFTGATSVVFGATPATSFTVDSDTQVTAVTPAAPPVSAAVKVATADVTGTSSADYTFVTAPHLSSAAPSTLPAGVASTVVLTGTDLNGTTVVTIGSTPVTSFTVDGPTQITAVIPGSAVGTYAVHVTTPGGTATTSLTVVTTPVIGSLSPAAGSTVGGSTVVITGSGFTGTTAVSFGGIPAASFIVDSDTTISAVTPPGALGVTTVALSNALHAAAPSAYTYLEAPSLTLGDTTPVAGSTETVTGTGVAPGSAVELWFHSDPVLLTKVAADASGRFTATVTIPATASGAHNLVANGVDANGRAVSASAALTVTAIVTAAAPQAPAADPPAGALAVTGRAFGHLLNGGTLLLLGGVAMIAADRRRTRGRRRSTSAG